MKKFLLALFLMQGFFIQIQAQETRNRYQNLSLKAISKTDWTSSKLDQVNFENHYYLTVRFNGKPSPKNLAFFSENNIQLLGSINPSTYKVAVPTNVTYDQLLAAEIKEIFLPAKGSKIAPQLRANDIPEYAVSAEGNVLVAINFFEGTSSDAIATIVEDFQINLTQKPKKNNRLIIGSIAMEQLEFLADAPIITFIDVIQAPDQKLNFENRLNQGINPVQSAVPGAMNLDGSGVVIGVGDGGELGDHIDLAGRVHNEADGTYSSFGAHGDHVCGIIAGAGNLNPRHKGMAPGAEVITQKTSLITYYTEDYMDNYGMVMTNNSYGVGFDCSTNGNYNYSSQNLDWQMNAFPELLHIFAAGNSGGQTCEPYPTGYKTVIRYYQSAKNVLTVGNVDEHKVIRSGSSRGPVADGRIKPEICGVGSQVISTGSNYDYFNSGGTSMAAPSVSGSIALMYQRYRQLNNNATPDGGLMKAIACNTAEDLGNPGPDYIYGFGLVNAAKGVQAVNENRYFSNEISTAADQIENVNIPAGLKQVKIMLYWVDKEAESDADLALVNDLNLTVSNPSGTDFLPWVLNADPAQVDANAIRAEDNLNNIEQVTIDNPEGGNYQIKIHGNNVPFGPQKYYVTYEFITDDVALIYPYGMESIEPSAEVRIQWDTDKDNASNFTAEYSLDNGSNWTTIDNNIPATDRNILWNTPTGMYDECLVRVSKNNTSIVAQSAHTFQIIGSPVNLAIAPGCEGTLDLTWDAQDGATSYEVFQLLNANMVSVGTTATNAFSAVDNLSLGQNAWFAVRSISSAGNKSERCISENGVPELGIDCANEVDAKMVSVQVNDCGRENTSLALSSEEIISVVIKNIGNLSISNFPLSYAINGGNAITEICNQEVAPGDSLLYNFAQTTDLSLSGTYLANAWLTVENDQNYYNDQLSNIEIVQLDNDVVDIPFEEDFSTASFNTINENVIGLDGLMKWDFNTTNNGSLLSTAANGNNFLSIAGNDVSISELVLTINVENLSMFDQLFLDFDYKAVNELTKSIVKVRGSDMDEWLTLMSLGQSTEWTSSIDNNLITLLDNAGQMLSSSFQVMFSHEGVNGFDIDNVKISNDGPLPIEMSFFTANKIENSAVELKWETLSEVNNAFFDIQVAKSYEDFSSQRFESLGVVQGKGTTAQPSYYLFLDTEPGKTGTRYYRLKQVDEDGTYKYSSVRSVSFDENEVSVNVFPNPFAERLFVKYESEAGEKLTLQITDVKGQLVQEMQTEVAAGKQQIELALQNNIYSGMYVLRIVGATKSNTFPIVKQQL